MEVTIRTQHFMSRIDCKIEDNNLYVGTTRIDFTEFDLSNIKHITIFEGNTVVVSLVENDYNVIDVALVYRDCHFIAYKDKSI